MMRGYRNASGVEVRLGDVQRARLEATAAGPTRCGPRNPSYIRLLAEKFVTSEQHVSTRTHRVTVDRLYTITPEGRRYLAEGRDR